MNPLSKINSHIKNNEIEKAYNLIINFESDYIDNADYWNLRGLLCLKVGEYKAAIGCLEKALMINPRNGDIFYNYAFAFESMGNRSDAALYYGLAYRYTDDAQLKTELSSMYDGYPALRNIFEIASLGRDKSFIILSSCGWGNIYQRMHHIARSLAKFGHEVIYVSPSISINSDIDSISESELINYSLHNAKIIDGVKIYTPISMIRDQKLYASNYLGLTQSLLDSTMFNQKVIISYLPYQIDIINSLKGNYFHIYECVDDHTDLDYAFWGNPKDIIWEQQLMDKADAITTTATALFLQRRSIEGRKNVFLSRNAVNSGDFIFCNEDIPEDLKHIPEPRIVYSGAIYDWFDTDLFYNVVKDNPDKSFVIIGFGKDGVLKEAYPNLYFLGAKKHSELKNYLRHMQVGIIPFKAETKIIINCDPIKQYEYISCNLPVVTTLIPESGLGKINTFLADTTENFNVALEKALNFKINYNEVNDFITKNSWNDRAALLCRISDGNISDKEKAIELKMVGSELNNLVAMYDSVIFSTLRAVYNNIESSLNFKKFTQESYNKQKLKYTERQYLTSLLRTNNIESFITVLLDSTYMREEIKQEILYRKDNNELDCIQAIAHYCIGDIKSYLNLINNITNKSVISIYQSYVRYWLGEEISNQELESHFDKNQCSSPLYQFLISKIQTSINDEKNNNKIISIVGYFGDENIGDEALLSSLINRLNKIPFVKPIVIAFNHPERVLEMHNIPAINGNNSEEVYSLLRMSDLVVLGPGGLIEDYARLDAKHFFSPAGMYRYLFPITVAQLYGKPVIGYGLGVGPLEMQESRNAIKMAFNGMKKVFVRDKKSVELLKNIGLNNVEISADAVLNLSPKNNDLLINKISEKIKFDNLIGISIRPFINIDSDRLIDKLSIVLAYLIDNYDVNFVFIPMQKDYDLPLLKKLFQQTVSRSFKSKNRIYTLDEQISPQEMMGLISHMDLLVGMRLHSIIMATATNVPSIALSYDSKINEYVESIGMEKYLLDANTFKTDILLELIKDGINDNKMKFNYEYNIKYLQEIEQNAWEYIKKLLS